MGKSSITINNNFPHFTKMQYNIIKNAQSYTTLHILLQYVTGHLVCYYFIYLVMHDMFMVRSTAQKTTFYCLSFIFVCPFAALFLSHCRFQYNLFAQWCDSFLFILVYMSMNAILWKYLNGVSFSYYARINMKYLRLYRKFWLRWNGKMCGEKAMCVCGYCIYPLILSSSSSNRSHLPDSYVLSNEIKSFSVCFLRFSGQKVAVLSEEWFLYESNIFIVLTRIMNILCARIWDICVCVCLFAPVPHTAHNAY